MIAKIRTMIKMIFLGNFTGARLQGVMLTDSTLNGVKGFAGR
jgi:hypothetical protein